MARSELLYLSPLDKILLTQVRISTNKKSLDEQKAILKKIIDVSNQQVEIMNTVKSLQQSAIPTAPLPVSDSQVYAAWAQSATNNAYLTALKALYDYRMSEVKHLKANIEETIEKIRFDELLIFHIVKSYP